MINKKRNRYFGPGRQGICGSENGNSKITEEIAREIRRRAKPHEYTRKQLAKDFGVSKSLVDQVLSGKIWRGA
jgi:DNA invertase Pin-like site-specific DNA recombinase